MHVMELPCSGLGLVLTKSGHGLDQNPASWAVIPSSLVVCESFSATHTWFFPLRGVLAKVYPNPRAKSWPNSDTDLLLPGKRPQSLGFCFTWFSHHVIKVRLPELYHLPCEEHSKMVGSVASSTHSVFTLDTLDLSSTLFIAVRLPEAIDSLITERIKVPAPQFQTLRCIYIYV